MEWGGWGGLDVCTCPSQYVTPNPNPKHRDQSFNNAGFQVPTVREYLDLLSNAPRVVGAVPETKHPFFFDSLKLSCMNGSTFTDLLADVLSDYGYDSAFNTPEWRMRPILVQSFEVHIGVWRANRVVAVYMLLTCAHISVCLHTVFSTTGIPSQHYEDPLFFLKHICFPQIHTD